MKTLALLSFAVLAAPLRAQEKEGTFRRLAESVQQSAARGQAEERAQARRVESARLAAQLLDRADAGQEREAIAQANRLTPSDRRIVLANAYLRLGERHAQRNELNGAYDAYNQAFQLWGRNNGVPGVPHGNRASWAAAAQHLNRLASVQERMGRRDEAAQSYRDALASLESMSRAGVLMGMTPEQIERVRRDAEAGAARLRR